MSHNVETNKNIHFSSLTDHWSTPKSIYDLLNKEFHFNYDPCPLNSEKDLYSEEWGSVVFCNPPYSELRKWLMKCYYHSLCGNIVVALIPSRTDTIAWHDYVMQASEIRFIKGRLKFGDSKNSAPFPSAIVIWGTPQLSNMVK